MNFKIGITDESFKLCVGNDFFRNDSDVIYNNHTTEIYGAKGLSTAFQLVALSKDTAVLSTGEEPAFYKGGITPCYRISVDCELPVSLSLIGMVTCDDGFDRADILLTDTFCTIKPDVPQAVYCSVKASQSVEAGDYEGRIKIFYSQGFSAEEEIYCLNFKVYIADYIFPKPQEQRFFLDLWQHNSNLARHAEVPLWSEQHFNIIRPYLKSLADLGQRCITVVASEIPWSGQACFAEHRGQSNLYEYSMIKAYRNADGKLLFDYSVMDKYIELCYKCGFRPDSEIEVFGLVNIWNFEQFGYGAPIKDYTEAIRIRVKEADGSFSYVIKAEEANYFIGQLESHFAEKGLLKYVRIVADEPADLEAFRRSIDNVHSIAPSFRFKAAINHSCFINEFADKIDDFVPIYNALQEEYASLKEIKKKMPEKRFLWYVCCVPEFPNTFLQSNSLEARAIGAITFLEDFDGFLRWNYTVFNQDPRKDLRYVRFPCGDMNFVYPAGDMRPLLSIRYEQLKRGIEDFELFCALKENGFGDLANSLVKKIIKKENVSEKVNSVEELLSVDPCVYREVRKEALVALANKK